MNNLHWMKLYIGDELSNTSHMTPAEFGSYIYLKMHYWRFGVLPADDERLARIAKVSPDIWRDILPSIGPLFGENWRDLKLEAQREEAETKHQARVEAGRKGGKAKRDARLEDSNATSNAKSEGKAWLKQPEPEPEPESYPAPESKSDPDPEVRALDKETKGTYTRPFPRPQSVDEGKRFLVNRGCPVDEMKKCLAMLMDGHLSPFDIEDWDIKARESA
ncbi:DUF1376 domain-containing protein [Rhizobium leguminosarum]|uniref:DUF1376 domain-containing protein n=1 Tax=Rhizobium leguminosarum TaxID=384 RepID=UPI0013EF56EB|nr:DUF1376 domain-containing protein [Rhizobium leguminosarum]